MQEEIQGKVYQKIMNVDPEVITNWINERKPYTALFELTAKCNFSCVHCYLSEHHQDSELDKAKVLEIIDILYDAGVLFLTFTGGEIFTRPDFSEIYLYAKKRGFLVELFTNGYLLNDRLINIFDEYPPVMIDISLYGSDNETYYDITGIENAFDRVVSNCQKLKERKIRFYFKTPVIQKTMDQIKRMKEIADDLDTVLVCTYEIFPTIDGDVTTQKLSAPLNKALEYEFEEYDKRVKKGIKPRKIDNSDAIKKLLSCDKVFACTVAQTNVVIDYKGNICPCMNFRHKGINLDKKNFESVWNDFGKICQIKASNDFVCKNCDARFYCDVCPAIMDLIYGNPEFRDMSMCRPAKIRKRFYEGGISTKDALNGIT